MSKLETGISGPKDIDATRSIDDTNNYESLIKISFYLSMFPIWVRYFVYNIRIVN